MELNILISTINSGIENVIEVLLPHREDVKYIISHQYTDDIYSKLPNALISRPDVEIVQTAGKGLSRSRNFAISKATGDICLIADDDVRYQQEYINQVLATFSKNKDVDVAVFKIKTPENSPEFKEYSKTEYRLSKNNFHAVSSIEIAFRLASIKGVVWFDERFGVGSDCIIAGEESIFIDDCLSKGKKIVFYPYYIVEHPFENTLKNIYKFALVKNKLKGAVDYKLNGWIAIPRSFYLLVRFMPDFIKHKKNPIKYLYERLTGVMTIMIINQNAKIK